MLTIAWWINLTVTRAKASLWGTFGQANHKRSVKGINLITLYYTDVAGSSYPVNFRIYDKREGKTKNDYFLEMLAEVEGWGLKPTWVTGEALVCQRH